MSTPPARKRQDAPNGQPQRRFVFLLLDNFTMLSFAGAIEPCIVRARDAIDAGAPPRLVALYDVVARRRHLRSIRVDADEIVLRLSPATDPALVEDALCAVIDACRQPTAAAPPYR